MVAVGLLVFVICFASVLTSAYAVSRLEELQIQLDSCMDSCGSNTRGITQLYANLGATYEDAPEDEDESPIVYVTARVC